MSGERHVEVSDIKILATSRGQVEYLDTGNGEVVLSLHGAMGGYDQASILARTIGPSDYRYLSLSRPGYLGTPLTAGKTPEEQADLYAEVIDLLHIREVIVIAISGGGPSAIHFALRHHDRCRGLVLVSTCGGKVKKKIPLFFHIMTLLAKWPAFVTMIKKMTEKNLKKALRRSISDPDILERTLRDADVMALYRELAVGMLYKMAERIEGTKNDIRITQTRSYPLKDIAVPTLVVHGTKDPLVPFEEHGKRLAAEIPGAQLLAAEGGEHATIFTHRREVQEKISAFLQELNLNGRNPFTHLCEEREQEKERIMDAIECIKTRRSIRKFKPEPVPKEVLLELINIAKWSPSYKNSQPWEVVIVSGDKKEALSKTLIELLENGTEPYPDLPEPKSWPAAEAARIDNLFKKRSAATGVDLSDPEFLTKAKKANFSFYGAPHVIYLFQDASLTPWSLFDLGLFTQSLLLSAHANGLGAVPQAFVTDYAQDVKKFLSIPKTKRLVLGISIGYPDMESPVNAFRTDRVETDEIVKWIQ